MKTECPKCHGRGYYYYDHNHARPCQSCCKHDKGWWDIPAEGYESIYQKGNDNGCCRDCGLMRRNLNKTP